MTPVLLSVTYTLRVPLPDFLSGAGAAAADIASTPGFLWKIWGLDPEAGLGTSVYLFRDATAAAAFADGPVLEALRRGSADEVVTRIAPVEAGLSALTGAETILALAGSARPPH
ncbi:YdhR family protein [Poseidonocella sp. HB161398]|uniref:YdhR family protein n=1 Tax=Poseidonocella sp. HB161398 TaxID=2320855 RepID=UPI001107BF1B|nr:YdhR family protein [Poseidonocella sp. HB161398]